MSWLLCFSIHSTHYYVYYYSIFFKVREEEGTELIDIKNKVCHLPIQQAGTVDTDVIAKVNALLQGYISRHNPSCHSLSSDMNFVQQNAGRLVRYLFEISLRQGWSQCATITLTLARVSITIRVFITLL